MAAVTVVVVRDPGRAGFADGDVMKTSSSGKETTKFPHIPQREHKT
ncbi:MAG: hypothetical protein IRZ07_30115 [Microbispora sp.]|nr:hypothetical protein [Microbispora sp.]